MKEPSTDAPKNDTSKIDKIKAAICRMEHLKNCHKEIGRVVKNNINNTFWQLRDTDGSIVGSFTTSQLMEKTIPQILKEMELEIIDIEKRLSIIPEDETVVKYKPWR